MSFCSPPLAQPIVKFDDSSHPRHYEILLRVQRPDGEVTSIADFLDAAERYQLLERLDSWVLAQVLKILVALDDFGTGLSSLMHLKDLDVHRIKIDGKFVRDVLSNARSRALIRALVQIADEIGLETVAEFVETADVASSVRELGVQCAQGYFYGRPRPLSETLRDLVAIHQEDPGELPEYRAVGS